MKSILAALVIAVASSSVACVASPEETNAPIASTSEALAITPVVDLMASALLESLAIEQVNKLLFPSESFDWDSVIADFADITKQANVVQTVSEQRASIEGRVRDLSDWELSVSSDPSESNKAFIAKLIDSPNNWIAIEGALGQLAQADTAKPGLAAYVMGAQLKLSMLGKLVQLRAADAATNRAVIVESARRYIAHVNDVLKQFEGTDLGWIRDTVTKWDAIAVAAAK